MHSNSWAKFSAMAIQAAIDDVLASRGHCNVVLTGGRSAGRLYEVWGKLLEDLARINVDFYFGDERCVVPEHSESNFGLVMRTLFACGVPTGCSVFRMNAESADLAGAAANYAALLPRVVDVLLLGVGEDGHIASLFPWSPALYETRRRVVPVRGPKSPQQRLTITAPVITQARRTFVLAPGSKAAVHEEALREPEDFLACPARLVLGATWLLDTNVSL